MKKICAALFVAIALIPAFALADSPVLLVELPENTTLVEDVEFDDGDFVQTYQTQSGATVQLLRYGAFDMTIDELIEGDWPDRCHTEALEIQDISGCSAQGAHIWQAVQNGYAVAVPDWQNLPAGTDMMHCTLVLVQCGESTLIFQGTFLTQDAGDEVQRMLESLQVQSDAPDVG